MFSFVNFNIFNTLQFYFSYVRFFFIFIDAEDGYELYKDKGCTSRDEIQSGDQLSREACARLCNNRLDCTSFEYWSGKNPHPQEGSGHCKVSSSCTEAEMTAQETEKTWIYMKKGYSTAETGGVLMFSVYLMYFK